MSKLAEHIKERPSLRNPPYRPALTIDAEERAELDKKLGDHANYDLLTLREMVATDPNNMEFRKAMVSGIASAEYAGVDAFSRKVCEWQDWDVPWPLIMAIARQTWDEVRHAQLATGVLESYGGKIGEYPDTLAGGAGTPPAGPEGAPQPPQVSEPISMLSAVNVSLEGAALTLFKETSKLGERIGDDLLAHCFDYNWADEVTHTMIGDFFVRALCEDDPDLEQRALRVHGMFEYMRTRLDQEQTTELKEFFADEIARIQAVFGAGQGGGYHQQAS